MKDFTWKDHFKAELINNLFNWEKLTEEQVYLILQPTEAPENFYCDGEIKLNVALPMWVDKLRKSGLSDADVKRAVRMNFKP
jgi:hypothetical protein